MEATPPHRPTFQVRLSSATISAIVASVLPYATLVSLEQLESGKSFNNRIYFLEVEQHLVTGDRAHVTESQRLVLKLSGHYFGPSKVQNEIGALLLLQKYCPNIPVPRLLAWSEDGKIIETIHGSITNTTENCIDATSQHGWILMTRLPGRIPTQADLTGLSGEYIMEQLAEHMAAWRSLLPQISATGNFRLRSSMEKLNTTNAVDLVKSNDDEALSRFTVGGLLLCHQYSPEPLLTSLDYYSYLARDQLFHLQRSPLLKSLNEKIGDRIQIFISQLPYLSFFSNGPDSQTFSKFTHLDFSPRNVLISDAGLASSTDLPLVTGLIDFEFAAFLPCEEEFLNMHIRQSDDWTPEQYGLLLSELMHHGCEVKHLPGQHKDPICTKLSNGSCVCDSRSFEGLSILVKIIANIAPWFIQDGAHDDVQLEQQCVIAAEAVFSDLALLEPFFKL